MDRKQFLKRLFQAGLCGCGAAVGFGQNQRDTRQTPPPGDRSRSEESWIADLEKRMIRGSETPDWRKVEKSQLWIRDLMEYTDAMIDQETRRKLFQACGRSCYTRAFGVAPHEKVTAGIAKRFLLALQSRGYDVRQEGQKTTIIYRYDRDHQNPWGLIMSDGFCMCPIVEDGPPGLSPTFCFCSTGYVGESFERRLGKPVTVELLDSLKMGGKECVFKVEVPNL